MDIADKRKVSVVGEFSNSGLFHIEKIQVIRLGECENTRSSLLGLFKGKLSLVEFAKKTKKAPCNKMTCDQIMELESPILKNFEWPIDERARIIFPGTIFKKEYYLQESELEIPALFFKRGWKTDRTYCYLKAQDLFKPYDYVALYTVK